MKVWLLLSRLEHGGLERVQLNLAKAMHDRSVDVSLVAGRVIADTRDELPHGVPVVEIAKAGPVFFPFGLVQALFTSPPDIVFTTSNDVACLAVLLRRVLFRQMRVVVTQHSSLLGPRDNAQRLKRFRIRLVQLAMRALVPKADGVVAVSQGVANEMRQLFSMETSRIHVIHNPIVTPDFDARMHEQSAWPWPDFDVPTIIYVGRLSVEKRVDLLIESLQGVLRRTPARLLIVGTGPEQESIERCIAAGGLEAHCRLTGFVANVLPLVRNATVLVLPSVYEGFGNVLVEAMACGTQVIATDCPHGPAEIVGDGEFGQLVPMNDQSALEAAILHCLEGRFHVPAERLKARAKEFALDPIVDRYVALARDALKP